MTPKISVVVPTFNRSSLVVEAIGSVLDQTYKPHEVIVVDDGSTDETEKMLRCRYGNRIRYFRKENGGPSSARNFGFERVTGDWIGLLDSDDLWLPDKLEWQVKALSAYGSTCGACFTDARFVNDPKLDTTVFIYSGRSFKEEMGVLSDTLRFVARLPHGIWNPTLIARTEIVREIGGFDSALTLREDDDFIFRLAVVTQFCYVNRSLALFDRKENRHLGVSENWHRREYCLRQDQYRLEKRLKMGPRLPVDVRKSISRDLRAVHSSWANLYLHSGRFKDAKRSVSTAAKYHLSFGVALKWVMTYMCPTLARKVIHI